MKDTEKRSLKELVNRQRAELFAWAKENLEEGEYVEIHQSTRTKEYGYTDQKRSYDPYYPSAVTRTHPQIIREIPRGPLPGADNIVINLERIFWRLRHPFRQGLWVNCYKDRYELIAPTEPVETIKFID